MEGNAVIFGMVLVPVLILIGFVIFKIATKGDREDKIKDTIDRIRRYSDRD